MLATEPLKRQRQPSKHSLAQKLLVVPCVSTMPQHALVEMVVAQLAEVVAAAGSVGVEGAVLAVAVEEEAALAVAVVEVVSAVDEEAVAATVVVAEGSAEADLPIAVDL